MHAAGWFEPANGSDIAYTFLLHIHQCFLTVIGIVKESSKHKQCNAQAWEPVTMNVVLVLSCRGEPYIKTELDNE